MRLGMSLSQILHDVWSGYGWDQGKNTCSYAQLQVFLLQSELSN